MCVSDLNLIENDYLCTKKLKTIFFTNGEQELYELSKYGLGK